MSLLVPSDEHPNALSALQGAIRDSAFVQGAVAFVTQSGVDRLASVLGRPKRHRRADRSRCGRHSTGSSPCAPR